MSSFVLAFNFSADASAGLIAQLNLTDSNTFLLDKGIQLQPVWSQIPMPPLNFASINAKSIAITAHDGEASAQQGVRVTLTVSANGSTLSGNVPFGGGPQLSVSYQFVGYSSQGTLQVGNFSIPFPTS